jgi:chromosome segregation ATPase
MGFELLAVSLAAGALTTLLRLLQDVERLQPVFDRIRHNQTLVRVLEMIGIELAAPKESYQARLQNLLSKFTEVSEESEAIVEELQNHIRSKETVVQGLEQKERELAARIDQMKESPEFVVAKIQELTEEIARLQKESQRDQAKESRRSALRDFALFALGVLVPYTLGWLAPVIGITLPATP